METIAKRTIRIGYYLFGFLVIIAVSLAVAVPYLISERKNYKLLTKEIEITILEEKKKNLQNIVLRTIIELDVLRDMVYGEYRTLVHDLCFVVMHICQMYADRIDRNASSEEWALLEDALGKIGAGVVVYDAGRNELLWANGKENAAEFAASIARGKDVSEAFPEIAKADFDDGKVAYVFMSRAALDGIVRDRAKKFIRSIRFDSNRYVWVNEILDYNGGDGYAVRVVHPNLPETEGKHLSTFTQDINGNFPYKAELEGVKESGELYFSYYFKRLDSNEVSKKLTYARLYKPFNWVVATGIHYDDIDSIVSKRRQAFERASDGHVMVFLAMLASVFVICSVMLYIFEKQLNSMVNVFVAKIKSNETELRCEKEKLSEAYKELEGIAFVDYLTGLFNRRAMCDSIKKNLERCRLGGANFYLILADIDKFKSINDAHGHDVGDIVLKSVAVLLKEALHKDDVISRWGGEEFLLMANANDLAGGIALAEKLRHLVASSPIRVGESIIHLTMTFGVVESACDKTLDMLVKEADQFLYSGKERTRNCVVSSGC